ncbi:hypothetical protein EGW08_017742 [Elysia chlorotica]|uniref:NWD1/2-like winged helix-turn-helix domain-containing protein n=1 Tax=Elysia chlorotica TaxID=188477 RepID=A0A3S1H8W4_ELYCH|nr:hypothetical protein EGW08_017742 [Elysia chlorotica]
MNRAEMASNHDILEQLSSAPDLRMRALKGQVEEELLIRLGAKREVIEIHPHILISRPERSKTYVSLKYSRTVPPAKEAPNPTQNPWIVADQALRQMSNFSRRGPRDFILPNLVKPSCPARTLVIPALDEEYFARRSVPPIRSQNPWVVADQALRQMSNFSRRGPRDFILPNLVKPSCPARTLVIPAIDEEYFARRAAAHSRLSQLLGQWTEYESLVLRRPPTRVRTATESVSSSQASIDHVVQGDGQAGVLRQLRVIREQGQQGAGGPGSSQKVDILLSHTIQISIVVARKTRNKWAGMASEALLHIKACHMRLPADMPRSELRIYVSSTPDLREEREFLEEVAYPKLREFSEKLGLNCHVVDMRNGAGTLDNSIQTFHLIEKELRACKALSIGPYFVSLLGHKSREAGLPGFFPKAVYELLRETLVREHILGVDAFDEVYRLDSNRAPPVYVKQRIQILEEYQSPEQVEKTLMKALKEAVKVIRNSGSNFPEVDFYRWSALVKEHEEGLLSGYSPLTDSLCFMMDAHQAEVDPGSHAKPIQRLRHAVFRHFRRFSANANLINFKSGKKTLAYLRSMSDTFIAGVASLLKTQIRQRDYSLPQQLTEGSEAVQHVRLALTAAHDSMDNSVAVNQVREILDTGSAGCRVIAVLGAPGSAKTTIACQVARASVLWEPRRRVVTRCVGSTLRSSSLYRVLESLINQLGVIYNCQVRLEKDALLQDVVSDFCDLIRSVGESHLLAGGLLIVLDQIDRLPDLEARFVTSILNSLPQGVVLLLTCQSQSHVVNVLKSHPTVMIIFRTFMDTKEVGRYIKGSLNSESRVATDDQYATALGALPHEPAPVYSQMLYHIIKWWPSAYLPDIPSFSGDPEEDLAAFLVSVESGLGEAFSRYALSLLASARHGLADQELLHLLSKDAHLLTEIEAEQQEHVSFVEGFPYQLQLSGFIDRLGMFLSTIKIEGESVYQLTSEPLRAAISQRYMNDDFFYSIHQKLANFFQFIRRGLLLSSKDISEQRHRQLSKYHWRTLRCVPYHLCHISPDTALVWEQLKQKVFFNFSWLVNAVYSGFLPDLLDDIAYALETVSLDPDIQYLQQLLIQVGTSIP